MAEVLDNVSPLGKPWQSVGTSMQPNALIMCKLLLLLLVIHGFQWKLSDPFIPFIHFLDAFRIQPGIFEFTMKAAFIGAGVSLAVNFKVRTAAIVLGVTVILAILASKPVFRNHIFIAGCLFLLAGLHQRDEDPWLIKLQFSVMYFGAFINKVLDPDWHTGQFLHNWLHGDLRNAFYDTVSSFMPAMSFAMLASWLVISSELLLAVFFLFRRWHNWGVWLAVIMHLSFLMIVGRRPFGHFTEDIFLALLVFLSWPKGTAKMQLKPSLQKAVRPFLKFLNWDRQFQLFPATIKNDNAWLQLQTGDRKLQNTSALLFFLKYNAATYVALFLGFNAIALLIARL